MNPLNDNFNSFRFTCGKIGMFHDYSDLIDFNYDVCTVFDGILPFFWQQLTHQQDSLKFY